MHLHKRLVRPLLALALAAGVLPATALGAPALKGVVAQGRDVVSVERIEDVPTAEETAEVASVDLEDVEVRIDAEGYPRLLTKSVAAPADGRLSALSTFPRSFDLRNADLDGDGVPDAAERDRLVALGWHAEGVAWYGV